MKSSSTQGPNCQEGQKHLSRKYGLSTTDALVVHLYAFFYRKRRTYIAFQFLSLRLFQLRARKHHERNNLHGYFCERFFGFPVGKYSYEVLQFCHTWVNIKSIGAFCSIAPNVTITGQNHPLEPISAHPFLYAADREFIDEDRPELMENGKNSGVIIGNDVWVGQNATILPCVSIGNGAIIGAGSVVTRDVPDYAIVAGNPAKLIRYRFDKEEREALCRIRWWDWPDETIKDHLDQFMNSGSFIEKFGSEAGE